MLQETHYICPVNVKKLTVLGGIPVYCVNHTKHTNTFCGQKLELYYLAYLATNKLQNQQIWKMLGVFHYLTITIL
jgi:hypothetical protein